MSHSKYPTKVWCRLYTPLLSSWPARGLARCLVLNCSIEKWGVASGPLRLRGLCGPPRGSCFSLMVAHQSRLLSSRRATQPDGQCWAGACRRSRSRCSPLRRAGDTARSCFVLHRPSVSTYWMPGTGQQLPMCWTLFAENPWERTVTPYFTDGDTEAQRC